MEPAAHNLNRTCTSRSLGRRRRPALRRGLTFIETVCAVALLGIVSATVFGAFSSIMSTQRRQQHRLNAMELANRLVLQYLDDKDTMPRAGLPILYSNEKYRWELDVVPVELRHARPDVVDERASAAPISVDRMRALTIHVWLSEESGGSPTFNPEVPAVTLTRLMDPIAMRNPDTTRTYLENPAKQAELIETFRGVGRNSGTSRPRNVPTRSAPANTPSIQPSSPRGTPK